MSFKWKKGIYVFLRRRNYGDDSFYVDYKDKYKIRSIGKKQAIVDLVRYSDTGEELLGNMYSSRGHSFYLTDPETISHWIEDHTPGTPLPPHFKVGWADFFVPAGDGDWDADENYHWS